MKRAIRNLIRFIAAGLITFGGMEIGLEIMRHRLQNAEIGVRQCVIGSALIIIGAMLLAFSSRLADRLSDDLDE
ncbi:MAG TPA: hypothetical protein VFW05_05005 [Verrucomicrobiae bacterium]|jgi:hypothetical protein|nr:hypothetical protein [Verrucomicrobiae bacterium]